RYEQWLEQALVHLDDLPDREHVVYGHQSVLRRQETFGYTHEELKLLVSPMAPNGAQAIGCRQETFGDTHEGLKLPVSPMARNGAEAIGSMGTDTPVAVLSDRPRMLFDYFSQLFAQVTNPPLDAIREELVTSLSATIGPEGNLLAPSPLSCRQVELPYCILDNDE